MKVKVISLPYISQVLHVLCFTRSRYQVSVYRTNGPLVYSGRIRTLVAMATYSSHRLIMGKEEIDNFFLSHWGYLDFFLQKYLLSSPLRFIPLLSKSVNLIGCRGGKKGQFSKKCLKIFFSVYHKEDEAETWQTC